MANHLHRNGTGDYVCEVTNKKMFTHDRAAHHAARMRRAKGSNHAEYHCRWCGYSHIGSTDSRRRRPRRRRTTDRQKTSRSAR